MNKYIAISLFVLVSLRGMAQQEFTLYNMNNVFQSSYTNVLNIPESRFSLSLGPLSSVFAHVENTAHTFNNSGTFTGDSTFFDWENSILKAMKNKNHIIQGFSTDIIGARLKVRSLYFSVNWSVVQNFRFTYSQDLFQFMTRNVDFEGKVLDISNTAIQFNMYNKIGFGVTRYSKDAKFSYGGRVNLLLGMANAYTPKSNKIEIATGQYSEFINLRSDMDFYMAGYDSAAIEKYTDPNTTAEEKREIEKNMRRDMLKNKGISIDLGVGYQPTKKWSFTLTVNDLGFINWQTNTRRYSIENGDYDFRGLNISGLTAGNDSLGVDDKISEIGDTLESIFTPTRTDNVKYRTWLYTQSYLSANFSPNKHVRFSATLFMEYFRGIRPGGIFATHFRLGRSVNLCFTYSAYRNSLLNVGTGFVLKLGPAQIYAATDNLLPLFFIYDSRFTNIRAGINWVFGKHRVPDMLPQSML